MDLVEVVKEAGPLAYLALAVAALGSVVGVVALLLLVTRSAATLTAGILTLVCAIGAAGAGMLGTVNGKRQVDAALPAVTSRVHQEKMHRRGYREAQSASMVGFAASLLPALLGALAAIGSRLRTRPPRLQGGVLEVAAEEGRGPLLAVGVLVSLAALASAGALSMARAPIAPGMYPFAESDDDSWTLAVALEIVSVKPAVGCRVLHFALRPFWKGYRRHSQPARELAAEWPRKFDRQPDPSLDAWKFQADACARRLLDATGAETMSREELLASPLLRDEAVRQELLARERSAQTGKPVTIEDLIGPRPAKGPEPVVGQGTLPPEVIRKVIHQHLNAIRSCYERGLKEAEPSLGGKLTVKFVISPKGTVSSAEETSAPAFRSAAVRDCVLARFRKMVFPQPAGGGQVIVSYPIIFKAADD